MLSVCLVLAGYTLLLHHKLSFAVWFADMAHNKPSSFMFFMVNVFAGGQARFYGHRGNYVK